ASPLPVVQTTARPPLSACSMAAPILHIKDSYYFEVPRGLWKSDRKTREDFPEHYIRLDPQYQDWEASRQYEGLTKIAGLEDLPAKEALLKEYHEWRDEHENFAKPFDRFLEEARSQTWFRNQVLAARSEGSLLNRHLIVPRPVKLAKETDEHFSQR